VNKKKMNIRELFETTLPAALASKSKEVREVNASFQVNVTGEGEWFIDATSKGPSVKAGQGKADCTITISSENFQALMSDPGKAMGMFFSGKLKLAGNQMLAMKLTKLLKT
jgi:putative sterol carrier protein